MQKSTDLKAVFLYGLTIFLSAFLLFQVQPMMGKMIFPLGLAGVLEAEVVRLCGHE
jgi:hypothetical protein